MLWLALSIFGGCVLITASITMLAESIYSLSNRFDEIANMFFAIHVTQFRMELYELGYECPDWLKTMDEKDDSPEVPPPMNLRLVKLKKDTQATEED